jgi:hypothetical protein
VRGWSARSGLCWLDQHVAWTGVHAGERADRLDTCGDRSDVRPGSIDDRLAGPVDGAMGPMNSI